jgi:hypothetical protein
MLTSGNRWHGRPRVVQSNMQSSGHVEVGCCDLCHALFAGAEGCRGVYAPWRRFDRLRCLPVAGEEEDEPAAGAGPGSGAMARNGAKRKRCESRKAGRAAGKPRPPAETNGSPHGTPLPWQRPCRHPSSRLHA